MADEEQNEQPAADEPEEVDGKRDELLESLLKEVRQVRGILARLVKSEAKAGEPKDG